MTRPRIFNSMASINIYLEQTQKDALTRIALSQGLTPSAIVRGWIDQSGRAATIPMAATPEEFR